VCALVAETPHLPPQTTTSHNDHLPQVTITLDELPRATRSLLLSLSNFGGGGFKRIATLQARLLVPGEAKGKDKVLVHCRLNSAEGADETLTQVVMLKLYKELSDSAFEAWAASGTVDVGSLAKGMGAKDLLRSILEARKQVGLDGLAVSAPGG